MFKAQDLIPIETAGNIYAAREAALNVMLQGFCDDRKAQIRAKVNTLGTKAQLVQMGWDLLMNAEGFRNPPTVKTYRGIGYKR